MPHQTATPPKPYPDFPMWPHASGSWCAVIGGARRHFGGWRTDPEGKAAMANYNRFMEERRRGSPVALANDGMRVSELVNLYLTRQLRRADDGGLSWSSHRATHEALTGFSSDIGKSARVSDLRPEFFAKWLSVLLKRDYAASTIRQRIIQVKAMLRWAFNQELIATQPRYGADFKAPRPSERRERMFTAVEIRKLLARANPQVRPMIRLGIECGFGNTDVGTLKWESVNVDKRIISMVRHKTKIKRRCVISAMLASELAALRVEGQDHVFITITGRPYVRVKRRGDSETPAMADAVGNEFFKLCGRVGVKIRGFYTLRRTHRTWTDELNDHHAAALCMGHNYGSVAGIYVQRIGDDRLLRINRHILKHLKQTEPLGQKSASAASAVAVRETSGAVGKRQARVAPRAKSGVGPRSH